MTKNYNSRKQITISSTDAKDKDFLNDLFEAGFEVKIIPSEDYYFNYKKDEEIKDPTKINFNY